MEVKLLLQHLIFEERCFRLEEFNQLIEEYELGYMESTNRPSPIRQDVLVSTDHSLRQSGL